MRFRWPIRLWCVPSSARRASSRSSVTEVREPVYYGPDAAAALDFVRDMKRPGTARATGRGRCGAHARQVARDAGRTRNWQRRAVRFARLAGHGTIARGRRRKLALLGSANGVTGRAAVGRKGVADVVRSRAISRIDVNRRERWTALFACLHREPETRSEGTQWPQLLLLDRSRPASAASWGWLHCCSPRHAATANRQILRPTQAVVPGLPERPRLRVAVPPSAALRLGKPGIQHGRPEWRP